MSTLARVSLALFVAAELAILLAVGPESWPLLVGWVLGALVVVLGARLIHGRLERQILAALLLPACVLLVFEGGLFFMPAAVALFVATLRREGGRLRLHHGR